MPKKRPPTWQRGAPRPAPTDPRPIRADASPTAEVDLGPTTTTESTWDPAAPRRADFKRIPQPEREGGRPWPRISSGWASVIMAGLLAAGSILWYGARMNTDISVNSAKIEALQKSQDAWTANLRDDIRRVEASRTARLAEVSRFVESLAGRGPTSTRKQ